MIFKSKTKKLEEEISELKELNQKLRERVNSCEILTDFATKEPIYYLRFEDALKLMLEGKTVESGFNGLHYKFSDGTFVGWSVFSEEWCVADMSGKMQLMNWRLIE